MKNKTLAMSLLAAAFSLGLFTTGNAQVMSACPQPCATNLQPATTTVPMALTSCPTSACPSNPCAPGLSGQVSTSAGFFGNGEKSKALTLAPGGGAFAIDRLGWRDNVSLTLVNPTNVPMRFDTVKSRGKTYSWLVPPNCQQTVSFKPRQMWNHKVEFLTYQDPSNAVAANILRNQAVASTLIQPVQQEAIVPPAPAIPEAVETPPVRRSAVRGFW